MVGEHDEPDPFRAPLRSISRSGRSGLSSGRERTNSSSGSSSHGFSGKLPLPEDFFPVPQLSIKEKKYLLGLAKHACKEVVYYSRQEDGPMDWLHLSSEDGVDVFQGVDNSATATQPEAKALTYLRGACKIYASIDEISDFFKLDTPEKLTGFTQTVGKDLLDQKTLLTLASPTEDNPKHYVAVKWTAVESPSKLARNRDFCYIECHDEFIDTNTKRRGWVRSIHSIRLPFCPPLHRTHGLVRGSFYRSGFIFTESAEKGCVDAVHTLHVDIKGNAPNWLKILTMKRRIKNIDEVNRYFQLRRLTQGKLLGDLELPAKDGVLRCQLCETKFGFFHRKRLCRKCGRVVCNPCGNEYLLDYVGLGAKKVRICVECSESVVFGNDVPAMDLSQAGSRAKKIEGIDVRPVYDESLSMSQSQEGHQFSMDEQEYYTQNEDASGIADMEDAKRMHVAFEKLLQKSDNGETSPANAASRETASWKQQLAGKTGNFDEMEDDDELGLPPSKSEQMMMQMKQEEELRHEQFLHVQKLQQYGGRQSQTKPQPEFRSLRSARPRSQFLVQWPARKTEPSQMMRNDSNDAFREWATEFNTQQESERAETGAMENFRSNGHRSRSHSSNAAFERGRQSSVESIPTLAVDQSFQSTSGNRGSLSQSPFVSSGIDFRYSNANARIPMPTIESSRGRYSSDDRSVEDDEDSLRRTQEYFDARNARLAQLGKHAASSKPNPTPTLQLNDFEKTQEFERAMLARSRGPGVGCGSDPPIRRMLSPSELESPYTSLSDDFTADLQYRNDEVTGNDDEAFRLAMSAMRLYEEERGSNFQITEDTRQAALKKMIEVYAREIERSHANDPVPRRRRGTLLRGHQLPDNIQSVPRIRRAMSDERSTPMFSSPLHVYTRESMPKPRRQRPAGAPKSIQDVNLVPRHQRKRSMSEHTHEYKDLSDLTSSAFQAFQLHSLGPKDAPNLQEVARSEETDRVDQHSVSYQRESTSTTPVGLHPTSEVTGTSGDHSGAAVATYGSITSSEVANLTSRPNSMYEMPDSDTFSDMDFTDLPHLMPKDDSRRSGDIGARDSFTDIQRWVDDDTSQVLGGHGDLSAPVEYTQAEQPRLSDLLSPLNLHKQHAGYEDSGRSSNSSSQIDWTNSLQTGTNGAPADSETTYSPAYSVHHQDQVGTYSDLSDSLFEEETAAYSNMLSESMVAHDGQQPQQPAPTQYHKPHSLSELLSEYCDSERSSLPSFAEYGAQPELEPEYLEAIKNSRLDLDHGSPRLSDELGDQYVTPQRLRQNSVRTEGGRRVRRSSSPPELEITAKRELFL